MVAGTEGGGRARGGPEFGRQAWPWPRAGRGNECGLDSWLLSISVCLQLGQGAGESFFPQLLCQFPSSHDFNFTVHIFSQQNPEMTRWKVCPD